MFVCATIAVVTTLHYLFLKKYRNIDLLHGVGLEALRKAMHITKSEKVAVV
jgi:hypothetical protein